MVIDSRVIVAPCKHQIHANDRPLDPLTTSFPARIRESGWLREWGNAVCWVAFHPGAILRKRQVIQHARKIPDRDILRNGPLPFREGDLPRKVLASGGEKNSWTVLQPCIGTL